MNSCNFFLLKHEEMESCIYCIKAANTWVRLKGRWHHLLVVLAVEKTVPFTSKRVCKMQFVSEICNHDPMFTLHIAGLRVDNSKSVIIYFFEKVSKREQMHTRTLYNLLIYIHADYKKDDFLRLRLYCTPAGTHLLRQHTFCCVLSIDFVKKSGIECCLWSAQCTETQARTFDLVKNWVFIWLNVQWWSFKDNVVYCNILHSIKAAFLELDKAMFTGATLVPMFTIITPSPYTHSKQSNTFHAKCNLKVNCEEKWVW